MDTIEDPTSGLTPQPPPQPQTSTSTRLAHHYFPTSSACMGYTNFGHEFDDDDDDVSTTGRPTNGYDEDGDSDEYAVVASSGMVDDDEDMYDGDPSQYADYSDFSIEELHAFMLLQQQQQEQSLLDYACSARRYSLLETIQEETAEELLKNSGGGGDPESRSEVSDYSGVWCWGDDLTDGAESVIYVEDRRGTEVEDDEEELDDDDQTWNHHQNMLTLDAFLKKHEDTLLEPSECEGTWLDTETKPSTSLAVEVLPPPPPRQDIEEHPGGGNDDGTVLILVDDEQEDEEEMVEEHSSWSDAIDAYLMSLSIQTSRDFPEVVVEERRSCGVGSESHHHVNIEEKSCPRRSHQHPILGSDLPLDAQVAEIASGSSKQSTLAPSVDAVHLLQTLESPPSPVDGDDDLVEFEHLGLMVERTDGDGAEERPPSICPKIAAATAATTIQSFKPRLVGTKSAPELFDVQAIVMSTTNAGGGGGGHVTIRLEDSPFHRRRRFNKLFDGAKDVGRRSLVSTTDDDFARSQSEPCVNSLEDPGLEDIVSPTTSPKKNFGEFDFVFGGDLLMTSSSLNKKRNSFLFESNDDLLTSGCHFASNDRCSAFSFSSKSFDSQFASSEEDDDDTTEETSEEEDNFQNTTAATTTNRMKGHHHHNLFARFTPPGTLRSFRSFDDALNLVKDEDEQEVSPPLPGPININAGSSNQLVTNVTSSSSSWMANIEEEENSEPEVEKIRPSSEDLSEDSGYCDILLGGGNNVSRRHVPLPVATQCPIEDPCHKLQQLLLNDSERRDRTLLLSTGSGQNLGHNDEIGSTNVSAVNEVALRVHDPDSSEEEEEGGRGAITSPPPPPPQRIDSTGSPHLLVLLHHDQMPEEESRLMESGQRSSNIPEVAPSVQNSEIIRKGNDTSAVVVECSISGHVSGESEPNSPFSSSSHPIGSRRQQTLSVLSPSDNNNIVSGTVPKTSENNVGVEVVIETTPQVTPPAPPPIQFDQALVPPTQRPTTGLFFSEEEEHTESVRRNQNRISVQQSTADIEPEQCGIGQATEDDDDEPDRESTVPDCDQSKLEDQSATLFVVPGGATTRDAPAPPMMMDRRKWKNAAGSLPSNDNRRGAAAAKKPPLPPPPPPPKVAICRSKIINAREQFFKRDADVQQQPVQAETPPPSEDYAGESIVNRVSVILEKFRQQARESRERAAKSVSHLNEHVRRQTAAAARDESGGGSCDAFKPHNMIIDRTPSQLCSEKHGGDGRVLSDGGKTVTRKSGENGDVKRAADNPTCLAPSTEDKNNSKRPSTVVATTSAPESTCRRHSSSSSSSSSSDDDNGRHRKWKVRSPSIGYLETDIDTFHSREVIRVCNNKWPATEDVHQQQRPPLPPPRRRATKSLQTRSMFNLTEGVKMTSPGTLEEGSPSSTTTTTTAYQKRDLLSVGDSAADAADASRAKSMEFLLKDENKASVLPPENQLQLMQNAGGGSSTSTCGGSISSGHRLSEHELRIRRSLQRLDLPEWYKNSSLGQMGSTEGLLLRRSSAGGTSAAGRPPIRWEDIRSRSTSTTSLGSGMSSSSVGGGGGAHHHNLHHQQPASRSAIIHKRVTTPDWRYVKSSRESLLQSPMSPSPSLNDRPAYFQYHYGSGMSRWSSSRFSSTTASSRSTSPTSSIQQQQYFQRQPYLGWRSSTEKLRTSAATSGSSTPTSYGGFYRSAAERLSQGPGYYALRFGLYHCHGSDQQQTERRGSNISSATAPPTVLEPQPDRPATAGSHPEITVNVFEPNGCSATTAPTEEQMTAPPEHVRVAAELVVREIDKMIGRGNGVIVENGHDGADTAKPRRDESAPPPDTDNQRKCVWMESSFVGVRPIRAPTAADAGERTLPWQPEAAAASSIDPLVRDGATTPPPPLLLAQVAEEATPEDHRLSLTSTTLEEVLDSLLALPSSSQSPSPSGYRNQRWDVATTDDTLARASRGLQQKSSLQRNDDEVGSGVTTAAVDHHQPTGNDDDGGIREEGEEAGRCLPSTKQGQGSDSQGDQHHHQLVTSSSSSSSCPCSVTTSLSSACLSKSTTSSSDLTTATTKTVDSLSSSSSASSGRDSSAGDTTSTSGQSCSSGSLSSTSGKDGGGNLLLLQPPPDFMDTLSSASAALVVAQPRTASTDYGTAKYRHSISPLHEMEDENGTTTTTTTTCHSPQAPDDDDTACFPPPPTHQELMQLACQQEEEEEEHQHGQSSASSSMLAAAPSSTTATNLFPASVPQEVLPADDDDDDEEDENRDRRHKVVEQQPLAPPPLDDTVIVRCSHHRCDQTAELREARKTFKTCHNCYTYYCSRECRKSHWERHRHVCMYGRIRSMCKQVIQHSRDNGAILLHLSRIARTGYLTQGRGFVKILFRNTDLATRFLRQGWSQIEDGPIYISWKDLLPQEMGSDVYRAVIDMCKRYDADAKFVLLAAIFITREVPMQSVPHWEREIIAKCAKVSLAKAIGRSSDEYGHLHQDPTALILTGPQPMLLGGEDDEDDALRKAREVCLANIEEQLEERGVSLHHQFPEVHRRLCSYVDNDDPFPPLTIYPKDGLTGQTFMCVIMPNSSAGPPSQRLHDWWKGMSMSKK